MIQWHLREVMRKYRIQPGELAQVMGMSRNAITNLRQPTMPRIDGQRLNQLLVALNQLRPTGSELISLGELMRFALETSELRQMGTVTIAEGDRQVLEGIEPQYAKVGGGFHIWLGETRIIFTPGQAMGLYRLLESVAYTFK
jgi:DNA-binding Xre family transcriptional regulator